MDKKKRNFNKRTLIFELPLYFSFFFILSLPSSLPISISLSLSLDQSLFYACFYWYIIFLPFFHFSLMGTSKRNKISSDTLNCRIGNHVKDEVILYFRSDKETWEIDFILGSKWPNLFFEWSGNPGLELMWCFQHLFFTLPSEEKVERKIEREKGG